MEFSVLDSLCWTEKMWEISGQEINIFPTSSPRVVSRFPIPTISRHFTQLFPHKLSINPHFLFMHPTPKSIFYPQIKILSMCSWTKTLETSKLHKDYQHNLNIDPTQVAASHLVLGISATSWISAISSIKHLNLHHFDLALKSTYHLQYLRSLPPLVPL